MDRRSLFLSAESGNLAQVAKILDQGVGVNTANEEDLTALHIATANGHDQLVQFLLRKGASLDNPNQYGWTALMYAAYYGHLQIFNILVQNKADINATNYLGATPVVCASRCGHVHIVQALIDLEADINQVDGLGNSLTPVMTASQHGHEAVVKLLCEHGANPNYRHTITGWTALMLAALNGHLNVVQLLVEECGADANCYNLNDQTAIDLATTRNRKEIVQYLKGKTKIRTKVPKSLGHSIIEAAKEGKVMVLRDLLKNNEREVDAQDDHGATPLIHASIEGHADVVGLLLSLNADVNVQDVVAGWTALMQATFHRHRPIIEMLLRANADVKIREHKKLTVFDLATTVGDPEVNRLLAQFALSKDRNYAKKWNSDMNGFYKGETMDRSPMRSLISKVSGRFQSLKSGKNDMLYSRVQPQFPAAIGGMEMVSADKNGSLGPTNSIWSVFDASKGFKEKPKISLVAPQAILPDDVMAPVMPVFARRTSFELPRAPKDVKLNSSGSGMDVSPQGHAGDGTTVSSSGYQTGRGGGGRHSTRIAAADMPDSPQSSQTSDSSFFTSVSQMQKASMPSAPGSLSRKTTQDRRGSGLGGSVNHTSIATWRLKHKRPSISPCPSMVSVNSIQSAPVARDRMLSKHRVSDSSQISLPALMARGTKSLVSFEPDDDDFQGILKRLSLENYAAKFEEEEVDMEAFLTMNEGDLKEIGVNKTMHRQQILKFIQELNAGKQGRDKWLKDVDMGSVASSRNQTRTSLYKDGR